jgi:uncharacterized membrane protein YdbT with pleckstrin-like domain
MSYIEKNLLQNEEITYRANLHWITFFGPLLLITAAGVSFLFSSIGQDENLNSILNYAGIIFILVSIFIGFSSLIAFLTSEFGVSNQRVLIKVGFIKRSTFELLLNKVESFQVDQSIMGRILGYGTILVSGTGMGSEEFKNIADPLELKKNVQQSVKEYERNYHQGKTPALVNKSDSVSVADEINKLVELKEKGVLTEDEFEEQKRKLLDE